MHRISMGLTMAGLFFLAGCASRESRVEGALVKAGVSGKLAACLAPRLADRLTDDQLRALAQAAKRAPGDTGKANAGDIIGRVSGLGDPEIAQVVSKAGLHCALKF